MRMLLTVFCCACLWLAGEVCGAAPEPAAADPLRSPLWSGMQQRFFEGQRVVFDDRVQVRMPEAAEDSLNVPVEISAEGFDRIEHILVFADLNPIPKILEFQPGQARPRLAFRLKVEQSTPVRAAVLDGDGTWHVGGAWISAAGGGCTMPSVGAGSPIWQERIGEVAARQWTPFEGGGSRLRFRVIHPMDTGLAAGIPVFHLEDVRILTEAGDTLARLALYEPVSENPVISLDFDYVGPVRVEGRDTQGNQVSARVTP